MELRQLQHFIAVAEERQFTRAAHRVNIVQSALSTSIRILEKELNAPLFVRSTREVRLTTAGEVFLDKARLALEAIREARSAVAAVQGLKRGTLKIGTVQSLPAFLDLPSLLARFHERHPGIEIRLIQGSSTSLAERTRAGTIDAAFFPIGMSPTDLETTMIACDELVIACPRGHPLEGRSAVTIQELHDCPFVEFESGWGTRSLVDSRFGDASFSRRIAFEVSDLDTMLKLVRLGLGIALLPETIVAANRTTIGMAQLEPPELCWELVIAHLPMDIASVPGPQTAAAAFLALLYENLTLSRIAQAAEID